jgi:ATP-dependent DNA helicase RecG
VGRGQYKSYCILLQGSDGGDASARLNVMANCSDGFRIAEEDLKLRGPGDFFGNRQHGLPELQIADLASSLDVLKWAQEEASDLLRNDPQLKTCPALRQRVQKMLDAQIGA